MHWTDKQAQNNQETTQKLAPCESDGRLLLRAKFFQVQSHVTQKLGPQTSKIRPEQIYILSLV